MGKVKFYCGCGKELFTLMPEYMKIEQTTIKKLEEEAKCSDCILKEAKEREDMPL